MFTAARPPEAGLSQDRTHRVPGMLLAINSDGERLGYDSQLLLSACLCLPCSALVCMPRSVGFCSFPQDHLVQIHDLEARLLT